MWRELSSILRGHGPAGRISHRARPMFGPFETNGRTAALMIVLDTDILIDHLRARKKAVEYLLDLAARGQTLMCSVISHAEILSGMRSAEEPATRAFLGTFHIVPIDTAVSEEAARYRRTYGPSHGVLLPDALIAATALVRKASLVTLNVTHYPMSDIAVVKPY